MIMNTEQSKHKQKSENHNQSNLNKPKKFKVDEFDQKAIFLCQFCGGVTCEQQDYLKNKIQPNAIQGLHSNWITEDILAMQRPSERLIQKYNLYNVFKQSKVGTILNLQQPGQHPFCGDGIIPQIGFSYIPEHFYAHGIRWFNECWEDMTSTTFQHMMKIMNIFDSTIKNGFKMSVHCHAGRGRTLLVICCWLIYGNRMKAVDTIKLAIQKRQGSLSSANQKKFLVYFQQQLIARWKSFGISTQHKCFTDFVQWQVTSLLTYQKKSLQKCPIFHRQLMNLFRKYLTKNKKQKLIQALINPQNIIFEHKFEENHQKILKELKNQINNLHFQKIQSQEDPRIIVQLFYDFYDDLPYTLVTSITLQHLHEEVAKMHKSEGEHSYIKILVQPLIIHDIGVSTLAVILDYCHFLKQIQTIINSAEMKSQNQKDHDLKVNKQIIDSLCMRFALLLLSKKKYFPQLFPLKNTRQCKILRYISKIKKIVSHQILFFADFLKKVSEQLPNQLEQVYRIIFKVCKVESNLFYLTQNSQHQFYSFQTKNKMYNDARQKLHL